MSFPDATQIGFKNPGQVIANVVIIEGTGVGIGLFLYNGIGQAGNPPVLAAVPPGVTADPFGNPVNAVMNIGTFTAAHIGWDANGNTYVSDTNGVTRVVVTGGAGGIWAGAPDPAIIFYNAFGATVLVVDPQRGGTFQYQDNNSNVQGGLIGAQVGKNTTDPILGNIVQAGVNIINPVFGDTTRVTGSIVTQNNLNWNNPSVLAASGGTPAGAVGPSLNIQGPFQTGGDCINVAFFGDSPDGTILGGIVAARGAAHGQLTKATSAGLEIQGGQSIALQDFAAGGPVAVAGYVQVYADQFGQLHTPSAFQTDTNVEIKNLGAPPGAGGSGAKLFTTSGHAQSRSGQAGPTGGDANLYDMESLINDTGAGTVGPITSTTGQTITGLAQALGVGKYRVKGIINYVGNQSAGTPTIGFTVGTLVFSYGTYNSKYEVQPNNGTGVQPIPYFNNTGPDLITGTHAGPALVLNQFVKFTFDMLINVTTAGTLTIQAKTSVAADTFTIQPGSWMEVRPIVA